MVATNRSRTQKWRLGRKLDKRALQGVVPPEGNNSKKRKAGINSSEAGPPVNKDEKWRER